MKFLSVCLVALVALATLDPIHARTESRVVDRDRLRARTQRVAPTAGAQRAERAERAERVERAAVRPLSSHAIQRGIQRIQPTTTTKQSHLVNSASFLDLQYYGGPIVAGPITMQVLTWGPVWGVNLVPQLSSFLAAIGGTSWWDIMLQYGTPSQPIISNSSLTVLPAVSLVDLNSSLIDDSQIQQTLTNAINNGQLTLSQNQQDIFTILFPAGVTITTQGVASCVWFCAYHGTVQINGADIGYIVMPDQGQPGCAGGCGGGSSSVFDNTCTVLSHEIAETVTDVSIGLLVNNFTLTPPLAWYNQFEGEIGDICNGEQGSVVGTNGQIYTIQKLWSNSQGGCVASSSTILPTNPAPTTPAPTTPTPTIPPNNGTGNNTGPCIHSPCVIGAPLGFGCSPTVTAICQVDSYCCNIQWDSICVGEVATVAHNYSCSPTTPPTPTPTPDPFNGTCAHSVCHIGVNLNTSCSPIANKICTVDPFCCDTEWDRTCVSEVLSVANLTCPKPAPPTPDPLNGTCVHSLCHIGVKLNITCSPIVTEICAVDSFCCDTEWDRICVSEVLSVANLTCPKPTPVPTTPVPTLPPTTPPPTIGNCSHSLCVPGVNLTVGCSPAVKQICAVDPFCCNTFWDRVCVSEVSSIAFLNCPTTVPTFNPTTAAPTTPIPIKPTTPAPTNNPTTPVPINPTTSVPTNPTTPVPINGTTSVPTTPAPIKPTTPVPINTTTPVPTNNPTTPVPINPTTAVPTNKPTTPVPINPTTPAPMNATTSVPTTPVPINATTPLPTNNPTTPVPLKPTTPVPINATTPTPTPLGPTTPAPLKPTTPVPMNATTSVPMNSTTPAPIKPTTPVPINATEPIWL